jgi:hypothetical protein
MYAAPLVADTVGDGGQSVLNATNGAALDRLRLRQHHTTPLDGAFVFVCSRVCVEMSGLRNCELLTPVIAAMPLQALVPIIGCTKPTGSRR